MSPSQTWVKPRAALQTPPSLVHSLTESSFLKISQQCLHVQTLGDGAFSLEIDRVKTFFGNVKSKRASKSHYWFRSYSNFSN